MATAILPLDFRLTTTAAMTQNPMVSTVKLGNKELFDHPKIVPYPYEVNWQIGLKKWFLNTNLFLIKPFLITKFDCTS